ncbi:MAG: chromosomal replication initiator protein DnaA [Clostridia bacterium]
MLKIKQIWNNVLMEMETQVTVLTYDIFIKTLEPVGIFEDEVVLLAETQAQKNIIEKRYIDTIIDATKKVFPTIKGVKIILEENISEANFSNEVDIPVSEAALLSEDNTTQFVEKYTFNNFVVGKSNEFAAAASKAVSENPGTKYNPLFIWGGVGLGKTHLMHAIGNYLKKSNPSLRTMYISCANFTNEYITALRDTANNNALREFRKKYRSTDVLMIDDIQFLANKESTQEEFFHTFNDLYLANKQVIICSDRAPKEINIAERLQTRFACGIIADIQSPDLELRIAILQKKCISQKQNVNEEVLRLIAEKVTTNIRDMEGLLNRIISYATLIGGDYNDMSVVSEALKDYTSDAKEVITLENIVKATCDYFDVDKSALCGKKKNKEIVVPRQICMYLVTDLLSLPLITIGEYFGGRDHTTIMHARDKITEEIKSNAVLNAQVKDIRDKILNK